MADDESGLQRGGEIVCAMFEAQCAARRLCTVQGDHEFGADEGSHRSGRSVSGRSVWTEVLVRFLRSILELCGAEANEDER